MAENNLLQHLPGNIESEIEHQVSSVEERLITLPGAIGEALVVTSKRIIIAREKDPAEGVQVYSYPLYDTSDVEIESSISGGTLVISVSDSAAEEERTLYFAAQEKPVFEAAADAIKRLILEAQSNRTQTTPNEPAANSQTESVDNTSQSITICSECSNPIDHADHYCATCGVKLKETCLVCSGGMPIGAAFCPNCGSQAAPASSFCQACGAKINSAIMQYCPQCGTATVSKCAHCGGTAIAGWPKCRYCGREVVGGGLPGRAFRSEVARRQEASASDYRQEERAQPTHREGPAVEHNRRAVDLFEEERYEEAIEEFRRAVALEPDDAFYHCNLAMAYDNAEQFEDAQREYERALELDPNNTAALLGLGYLLNEQGEKQRAAQFWQRLIAIAPGSPEAEEAQQNLRAQEAL